MLLDTVCKLNADSGLNLFKRGVPKQTYHSGKLRGINKAHATVTEYSVRKWFEELEQFLKNNEFSHVLKVLEGFWRCKDMFRDTKKETDQY